MTANISETRWELLQVNVKDENFTVIDKLAKKRRVFHVPYLLHAEIAFQDVYIFTSNSKIMQLNLLTASRQFLTATQLDDLKKIQQTHKSFIVKNNASKKLTQTLKKIASLPSYAFLDTINSY
jgi:hypothetical protein